MIMSEHCLSFCTRKLMTSIVSVTTNSIILKPEHRGYQGGSGAPAGGKAQAPMSAQSHDVKYKAKRKAKGGSSGAASVFLFILKVSKAHVEAEG